MMEESHAQQHLQRAKSFGRSVKIDAAPEVEAPSVSRASPSHSVIEFACDTYACVEGAGTLTIQVRREGAIDQPVSVLFDSIDGTAKAGEDFEKVSGTIDFAPGQTSHDITIKIFDDDEIEPDEVFTVALGEIQKVEILVCLPPPLPPPLCLCPSRLPSTTLLLPRATPRLATWPPPK